MLQALALLFSIDVVSRHQLMAAVRGNYGAAPALRRRCWQIGRALDGIGTQEDIVDAASTMVTMRV